MTFTNQLVQSDRDQGPARPMTPAEREQEEYKQAQRERVATAVEVGGLCQDLTAYVHLVVHRRLQRDKPHATSQTSGPRFAPDLLVRLTPEAQLKRTYKKLLKLEPMLLAEPPKPGTPKPDETKPTNAKPDGTNTMKTGGKANYASHGTAGTATMSKPNDASPDDDKPNGAKPNEVRPNRPKLDGVKSDDAKPGTTKPDEAKPSGATPDTKPDDEPVGAKTVGTNTMKTGGKANYGSHGTAGAAPIKSNGAKSDTAKPDDTSLSGPKPDAKPDDAPVGAKTVGANTMKTGGKANYGGRGTAGTTTLTLPSRASKVDQKVGALLPRDVSGGADSQEREYPPVDLDDLYSAICHWNELIVESIIDYPAVLAGFRVGKALSFTRWQIQIADERWNQVDELGFTDPWDKAFNKQRIDEIQRYVNTLSTVLDGRAVAAVSTGLGYWRNALLSLTTHDDSPSVRWWSWRNALRRLASMGEPPTLRSAQPSSSQTIRLSLDRHKQLITTLEDQVNIWVDVLTERRPPESFPVAGIVASLTKKVAANLWARLFRLLVPTVIVLVIVGGLLGAVSLFVDEGFLEAVSRNLTTLLGSLGTALAAVFTFFLAPRGPSMLGRGSGTTYGAWGGATGGTRSGGVWPGRHYGSVGAFVNVAANLKQDVLSNVVEQLRLEDINLAINEPLVRCVLSLKGQETGDPRKDAERFLKLVYKGQSNLKRLRPLFKELYKY